MQEFYLSAPVTASELSVTNTRPPSTKDNTFPVLSGDASTSVSAATIPRDILTTIFYEALHQHDAGVANFNSAVPTISYLSSASPIPLAHVCSHWRDVVIRSSQLWSEICIDHPRESHICLTELWLKRAGTCPLKLTVKTSPYITVDLSHFSAIFQLFVSKIHQWQEIDFEVHQDLAQMLAEMVRASKSQLNQLQSASISIRTRTNRPFKIKDIDNRCVANLPIDIIWESLHSSPCLISVNWNNLYEGLPPPAHAPWSKLTQLDLHYFVGICEILRILSLSPNMKIFRATGSPKSISEHRWISYINPLVHNLSSLCLTATENVGDLFSNIVLPELRKLHITYQNLPRSSSDRKLDGPSWNLPSKFQYFLSQSKCNLNDVWLDKPPYSDNDMRSHLSSPAFQSVRRLRLSGTNLVTDDVIHAMTLRQGGVGILTNITSLWLDIEETEITDGLISTMVASRWLLPVTNLKEVRLTRDFLSPFGSVDTEKLSSMMAEGLRVSISPGTLGSA